MRSPISRLSPISRALLRAIEGDRGRAGGTGARAWTAMSRCEAGLIRRGLSAITYSRFGDLSRLLVLKLVLPPLPPSGEMPATDAQRNALRQMVNARVNLARVQVLQRKMATS